MEDKLPEQWLPSYRGSHVNFKTKLCIEMTTKSEQTKYWFKIKVDPQTSLSCYDFGDSDSSNVLRRTNPFLNTDQSGSGLFTFYSAICLHFYLVCYFFTYLLIFRIELWSRTFAFTNLCKSQWCQWWNC